MKYVVLGKKVCKSWELKDHKKITIENNKRIDEYCGKPELIEKTDVIGYEEILRFEGTLEYNEKGDSWIFASREINISEDEEVTIEKKIFRADLNETYLYTDKVVEETSDNEEDAQNALRMLTKKFNKSVIEKDEKMMNYCKLVGKDPKDVDCIELFKMLYPGCSYTFINGKIEPFASYNAASLIDASVAPSKLSISVDPKLVNLKISNVN